MTSISICCLSDWVAAVLREAQSRWKRLRMPWCHSLLLRLPLLLIFATTGGDAELVVISNMFRRERPGSVALLASEGYRGLGLLCSTMHGERLAGSRAVLRSLLPGILMAEKEQRADLTPKERAVVREHGINFVLYLVESAAEEAERKEREEAAVLLVQHMAAKVPDKADWRREAASGILILMEVLSPALLHTTTRWILKFAHSEKPSNRLFSLEVDKHCSITFIAITCYALFRFWLS